MTPNLNISLAKAKAEIPAILANRNVRIPTKSGREISFTYAELEEIIPKVTPVLSSHGLAIAHQMQFIGDKYCLVTSLRHESGEQIESVFLLPVSFGDTKELGVQIAYGRRYNTLCLLDITVVDSQNWEETKRKIAKEIRQESGLSQKSDSKQEGSILHDMAGIKLNGKLITEAQAKRLWAIAKGELKLNDEIIKSVQQHYGFEKTELITSDKYEAVISHLRGLVKKTEAIASAIDRDLVYQEISSIIRRKGISVEDAKKYNQQWFNKESRDDLSDPQLVQMRDKLALLVVEKV